MTLELKNVNYIYNYKTVFQKHVLKDINFKINDNEVIFIIGKSGSGKTTLLYLMDFLLKPTFGEIVVDGEDPFTNPHKFRKKIGFAFQFPEKQFFSETVEDEIMFSIKNFEIKNPKERLEEIKDLMNLDDELLKKSPFQLSGGQQRKVAIASAIAHDPELLILDEPTVSLDYKSEKSLIEFLKLWVSKKDKTLIIVTHDLEKFLDFKGKTFEIVDGRLFPVNRGELF
ncbi:cobalt import ATP-binding protein CbiO 2 [Thermosipho africanus Ob7]|uniref:ATP-binding cassette domain-containing protein n=1 Tax=Thermosipho africanus TaxID=2421 RepID=UPI000E0B25EE|nr:ATP-binding cassette domain-containing protein [Thermosipho africanus]RDI91174.1 cobalt import ATP-binding protein CbiO 2 [Thermosipho africanus Ob7]